MSEIITPTVGRKVWYRPSAFDRQGPGAMQVAGKQPLDATIVAVWGDRCVNVLVLDCTGKSFSKTSVMLFDPPPPTDAEGNDLGGYVEWVPYQRQQAEKTASTAV